MEGGLASSLVQLTHRGDDCLNFSASIVPELNLANSFGFSHIPFRHTTNFTTQSRRVALVQVSHRGTRATVITSRDAYRSNALHF